MFLVIIVILVPAFPLAAGQGQRGKRAERGRLYQKVTSGRWSSGKVR
jgi:hypothetical protein